VNQRNSTQDGLVWLSDGHVSDWGLNALVDDQAALLPGEAVSHVDRCEHCTDRLAMMASMVFALDEELRLLAVHQGRQKAPFPVALFAAAFLLSVGFALLSWRVQGRAIVEIPHELLTLWRGLRLVGPVAAQRLGVETIVVVGATTLVFAIGGVMLARRHPFIRSPESPS
jgi:hypothetical protein